MWRDHSRVQLQRERERDEEKQHTAELCSEVAPRLPGVFRLVSVCIAIGFTKRPPESGERGAGGPRQLTEYLAMTALIWMDACTMQNHHTLPQPRACPLPPETFATTQKQKCGTRHGVG